MSRPAGPPAPAAGAAPGQPAGSSGLLGKLLAAVRPELRASVLVFDPADPVFGGAACLVGGCRRRGGMWACAKVTISGGLPPGGLTWTSLLFPDARHAPLVYAGEQELDACLAYDRLWELGAHSHEVDTMKIARPTIPQRCGLYC